jgi:Fe-S-cluster containining protein
MPAWRQAVNGPPPASLLLTAFTGYKLGYKVIRDIYVAIREGYGTGNKQPSLLKLMCCKGHVLSLTRCSFSAKDKTRCALKMQPRLCQVFPFVEEIMKYKALCKFNFSKPSGNYSYRVL